MTIESETGYNKVIEKENEQLRKALEMGTVPEQNQRMFELIAEIDRLKDKCDKQAKILRQLDVERFPGKFITAEVGEKDQNGMPKFLWVVPTFGVDFSYVYEYTGRTVGGQGS